MIQIAQLNVLTNGSNVTVRWDIPAEAHAVGLASTRSSRVRIFARGLTEDDAAHSIGAMMMMATAKIERELCGAWCTHPLF